MSKVIIKGNPDFKKARPQDEPFLKVAEFFSRTLQGEGVNTGTPSAFLRLKDCTMNCHWCFLPQMTIHTRDRGIVRIDEVKEGEVILTLDESGGIVETTVQKVLKQKVSTEQIGGLFLSKNNRNRIYGTLNHPFKVKGKDDWIQLQDLQEGDVLYSLKSKQYDSYRMKRNNPSHDPEILAKGMETQRQKRLNGEIVPYERSEELKDFHSKRMKENNPSFDPEIHKKSTENRKYKISKLEQRYQELFTQLNLPIKYIGSGKGKKAIGSKKTRYKFPDFIIEGKRKVIEVYDSTYKYSRYKKSRKKRDQQWKDEMTTFYKDNGYEVLFLNEEDIKIRKRKQLSKILFDFVFNGVEICKVHKPLSKKQKARLWGSSEEKEVDVYNLQCYPYNTYLIESCLVHNCDSVAVWRFGNAYSIPEILEMMENSGLVDDFKRGDHLVLTGGSPLKQQEGLVELLKQFQQKYNFKPYIEIENEVVLDPLPEMIELVDCWNNSPKLSNSQQKDEIRYKPELLKKMSQLDNAWFKFVVAKKSDWEEIEKDFLKPQLIRKDQVIVMPCGQDQEELEDTREFTADIAIKEGVRFSEREHIVLWDKMTGV